MMITVEKARENVANFNKREDEARTKRAKAYVNNVCEMIERASNNGNCSIVVEEMEYLSDHNIAEKILKDELGFEIGTIPGKSYIRISW